MQILDTDILTHYFFGKEPVVSKVNRELGTGHVAITIATKAEILRGRFEFLLKANEPKQFIRAQDQILETEKNLHRFPILLITDEAIRHFQQLARQKSVRKIGRADLLIACISLANNATLITRNTRDFTKVPNLKTADWADDS